MVVEEGRVSILAALKLCPPRAQLLERRLERGDFCFSAALEAASARWTRCAASVRPRIDSSASTCLCAAASSCACSSLSFDSAASTVW